MRAARVEYVVVDRREQHVSEAALKHVHIGAREGVGRVCVRVESSRMEHTKHTHSREQQESSM